MHCGFDIGGTKVLGVAVTDDPVRPRAVRRRPTTYDAGALVETLVGMVADLEHDTGERCDAMGLGIAGIVDRDGTLRYSPNIPGVVDLPVRRLLTTALERPVVVENDATAATWAEVTLGAGRGSRHVAFVALGTGIGTGFVFDGRLHRGWNGFSGESGHMIVDKDGPVHLTGARGPWEYFASGNGLGRLAREEAERGGLAAVRRAAGSIEAIRGEHVHHAVVEGDAEARALVERFAREVAVGVANLVHVLDPETVVIGGGLVEMGAVLVDAISRFTDELVLGAPHRPRVRVVAAQLGSRAGALGAALLAADELAGVDEGARSRPD